MNEVQVLELHSAEAQKALVGGRPTVNKRSGQVTIRTARGMMINSALRKDEWEELDRAIVQAAVQPLVIVEALRSRGLTRTLGGIGTMIAQYNQASEMTAANISLRGHASGEKDLVDFSLVGVPVPIIFKEFEIDTRYLESSRRLGDSIDVANGAAAARVVAEKIEDLAINGDTSINLNGSTIYGLTTHPNRNTDTATNYGGGDWGTVTNVLPTIAGMVAAAQGDGYYGPYGVFVSNTQYNQASLVYFTDGSNSTPRTRIMGMPQIEFFLPSAQLADGVVVLVQLTRDVIELAFVEAYWPITNLEWTSGDSMLNMFKVLSVYVPMVKSAFAGKSGIVHATGS